MITLTRIDHINMKVKDLEAAKAFYGEVFGFEVKDGGVRGGMPWAVLGAGGKAYLCLYEHKDLAPWNEEQRVAHFGFAVEDFDAVAARLEESGVSVDHEADYGASRSLYIEDPSGNEIELSERLGGGLG